MLFTASFAAGAIFLIVMALVFRDKSVSPSKLADEADKLKAANAKVVANLGAGQVSKVRAIDGDDFLLGKKNSKNELIVYLDFDCPFSRSFFKTIKQVNEVFGKDLAIALRHYPLDSHPGALEAAQAFECAREQEKALPMAEALFDNQDKNDNNTEGILADAQAVGLKMQPFKSCLSSKKYQAKILAGKEEAGLFGVMGAPTSFLNGRNLPGAYQFEDFSDATGRQYEGLKTLIAKEIKK